MKEIGHRKCVDNFASTRRNLQLFVTRPCHAVSQEHKQTYAQIQLNFLDIHQKQQHMSQATARTKHG